MYVQPTVTSLSSKGQVVIPLAIRKYLDLRPKSKFMATLKRKKIILESIKDPVEACFGLFSDLKKSSTRLLKEARREEQRREKHRFS